MYKTTNGMMLVEAMLASLLGLLLVSCLFKLYISMQKSYQLHTSLTQVQASLQSTLDILTHEIRLAGYIGCAKLTDDFPIKSYQSYSLTTKNKLQLFETAVSVKHASQKYVNLARPMQSFFTLELTNQHTFKVGDILIISDCRHAEIFCVKKISHLRDKQIIVPDGGLHSLFDDIAEVSRFESHYFYLEHNALYDENIRRSKMRLVDGINSLSINTNNTGGYNTAAIKVAAKMNLIEKKWYAYVAL
jgi:hypothetical protein